MLQSLFALFSSIPWWAWSMIANVSIITTEYVNRHSTGSWITVLPTTAPLIILAQFGLFCTWRGASSWYMAWIVFTLGNSIARAAAVATTQSAGEITNWGRVAMGVGVMLIGSQVLKTGIK